MACPSRSFRAPRAASALLAFCGAVAGAQPDLIVAEYQFQNAQISRMGPGGSNPQVLFALPPSDWLPLGIAWNSAASKFLWIDSAGASEIYQSNLNGTGRVTLATPPGFARGPSLDGSGRIFFATNNEIRRVNADGSGQVVLYTAPTSNPTGQPRVDVTNGHVYFGADGRIFRMDLDGSNRKTVVGGISQPKHVALDIESGHIYWIDGDTISDYIGRARLDGSEFTVLIDNSPSVVESSGLIELLVDPASDMLFYGREFPTDQVFAAALDGNAPSVIYTSDFDRSPSGLTFVSGEPAQALLDCDGNGISDTLDIASGAPDCDNNGYLDSCQIDPCPARVLLLDHGSNAALSSGKALGAPSAWQIFQPVDVPAGGWSIGEIGLDGFNTNYGAGLGLRVTVYPDDGSLSLPDEGAPLAQTTTTINLRFNINYENWVYAPLEVSLPEGRFWFRIEALDPITQQHTINFGLSGNGSRSRGSSGNFSPFGSPAALRLVQARRCPADLSGASDPNDPAYGVPDGAADAADFFFFLDQFVGGNTALADLTGSSDPNDPTYGVPNGSLDAADFFYFLDLFVQGC